MAVSALIRQSEDKIAKQAYLRRKDEIYFNNMEKLEFQRKLEQEQKKLNKSEKKQRKQKQKMLIYAGKLKNYAPHKQNNSEIEPTVSPTEL